MRPMPKPSLRTILLSSIVLVVLVISAAVAWMTDWITISGERTIYTVECAGGDWIGARCPGRIVAGERYKYRAFKSDREVWFWILGADEPFGRLENCDIKSGRQWTCQPSSDSLDSLTYSMWNGKAVYDESIPTISFHATSKLRWWLAKVGVTWFHSAD